MSFIYDDKNLIDKLIQSATDFENKFSKKGQAAPAVPPGDVGMPRGHVVEKDKAPGDYSFKEMQGGGDAGGDAAKAAIALKLLNRIEQSANQVAHPELGTSVISSEVGDADLTSIHLENLGSLIQFLVTNKIMVDYRRIAYADNENPNDESYVLYNVETTPFFAQIGYNSTGFYLNKDLLVKYLTSLQARAHSKQIKFMDVQLKHLIEQAGKLGVKVPPYQSPSEKTTDKEQNSSLKMTITGPGAKGAPGGEASQEQTSELIADMINNLPLARENIDFNRIDRFLDLYTKLIASNPQRAQSAMSSIANARAAMAEAEKFTNTRVFGGITNLNANTVQYWINQGNKSTTYSPFLGALRQVVTSVANVVNDFASSFRPTGLLTKPMLDQINYQVGGGTSYEFTNTDKIDWLRRNPPVTMLDKRRP